ncbi:GlsB/YeaQ/YmgE family stress response membrane protein [Altererythrobacter sp. Z27]|uniref:GlsB/YeaQ/YmgE family stress response membrane protein n=1 Tax=Altererythrobacter sp. Z27 TaxID=3461147 RepID=UPI0040444F84
MSVICLVLIGALIGWLAAIVTRVEDVPGIRRDLLLGVAGALVAGLLANKGVMLGGLSWLALAAGIFGGVLVPAAYKMIEKRRSA